MLKIPFVFIKIIFFRSSLNFYILVSGMVCVLDITLTQLFHSFIIFVINKLEFRLATRKF